MKHCKEDLKANNPTVDKSAINITIYCKQKSGGLLCELKVLCYSASLVLSGAGVAGNTLFVADLAKQEWNKDKTNSGKNNK